MNESHEWYWHLYSVHVRTTIMGIEGLWWRMQGSVYVILKRLYRTSTVFETEAVFFIRSPVYLPVFLHLS